MIVYSHLISSGSFDVKAVAEAIIVFGLKLQLSCFKSGVLLLKYCHLKIACTYWVKTFILKFTNWFFRRPILTLCICSCVFFYWHNHDTNLSTYLLIRPLAWFSIIFCELFSFQCQSNEILTRGAAPYFWSFAIFCYISNKSLTYSMCSSSNSLYWIVYSSYTRSVALFSNLSDMESSFVSLSMCAQLYYALLL